jgi:hypothetical protein
MKTLFRLLLISIGITIFTSCEKEITVDIPDNNSKIVISCHLGVGDSISAKVSASIPLYELSTGENKPITNATIKISTDNSNWMTLDYESNQQIYFLSKNVHTILASTTYFLSVSAPGYTTITSEVTTPVYQPISPIISKIDTSTNEFGNFQVDVRFKFTDVLNQANYYGAKAFIKANGLLYELNNYNEKSWVFSDKLSDGKEFILNFSTSTVSSSDSIMLRVFQTSESFYQFHYSLFNYSGESPFSEATPVYSNITNGLGIFSGYDYRDYTFPLQ